MQELQWFPKTSQSAKALTQLPATCLRAAQTDAERELVALGALAFNSPALLGGQAEKNGLSCGACHRNGRGAPEFQFEAISGAPGTADVTSGLFSRVRADNVFNPVPIPDLARAEGQDQVNRTDRAALAAFVRGQIEDEFSGDPPSEPVFEALLTYLQHIDAEGSGCDLSASTKRRWQSDWADAERAARQGSAAQDTVQDTVQAAFYVRTARLSLGRIYERYPAPSHADIRTELIVLSRRLERGAPWPADTQSLQTRLEEGAEQSLYTEKTLAAALLAASAATAQSD